jgi:hypothetical protein
MVARLVLGLIMLNLVKNLKRHVSSMRNDDNTYQNFLKESNPPWKPGYQQHKEQSIVAAINDPDYDPDNLPPGHGWRLDERIVEYPWFFAKLPEGAGRLLDAGSVLNCSYLLMHPRVREKRSFVSTLAPEQIALWQQSVSYVYEDLRDSCFRDDYFDWICCLSTLEHVGLNNTMLYTADESKRENDRGAYREFLLQLRRMLRPGGTLFLSVPFGRYQNHGWFQVFNSAMADDLIATFAPSAVRETIYQYLPEGWIRSDRESAKDALYFDIHKRKIYDPDYAAASRAVICLELAK